MKNFCTTLFVVFSLAAFSAHAQVANDVATQNAIIAALPAGVTPETATADQIAQAATDHAFGKGKDNVETNVTQAMIAVGELTRAGRFTNALRFGNQSPTSRFYLKVLNLASSNLDVSSNTYYSLTVQDMTRLAAAARAGTNFLNGATSNAITRK